MRKIPFNRNWERITGTGFNFFFGSGSGDTVDLPDDFVINSERSPDAISGPASGYFEGGQAAYVKRFAMPEDWADQTVLLDVDGAYMNASVHLNQEMLAMHPYGYTPFFVDLTSYLAQENTLRIVTQNRQPNSRWYSGGGLYRQVNILLGGRLYIHPWSVFITTHEIKEGHALVRVEAAITNTSAKNAKTVLRASLCSGETAQTEVVAIAGKETKAILLIDVKEPALWDVDTDAPPTYTLTLDVLENGAVADTHTEDFGIRSIEIDSINGFRINGKMIKLRGGCIHHDHGMLGAAAYPAAEERKVRLLKEAGYNAVRCAHNPPSRTFLDACDRLGMLVLDETFDCWKTAKNGNDYHLFFDDWWERDTTAMVLRDRNHPSVFAWSIGNEIGDFTGRETGVKLAEQQAALVRSLDPSRPVTACQHAMINFERAGIKMERFNFNFFQGRRHDGIPGMHDGVDHWGLQTERPFSHLDLAGYNYIWQRYANDITAYPHRVIMGTETHPFTMYEYWQETVKNPNVIGDFIWTAWDNLGEAGAGRVIWDENDKGFMGEWPWLSCYQGDIDLAGNRLAQSYYHKILWGLDDGIHLFSLHPECTGKAFGGTGWQWYDVFPEWGYGDAYVGKPIEITAYADCEKVEFLLNGKSLGFAVPEKYIATMTIPYEMGTLEAIAYRGGKPVARDTLVSAGAPAKLALVCESDAINADGLDLAYVRIDVLDKDGNLVGVTPVEVSVEVEGAGTLAGLGSGCPHTDENFGTGKRLTWHGSALAILRAGTEAGEVTLRVTADGLTGASVTIKVG